jgi:predicted RNA-binding Zn-ribbon protein involved in translation (DUF1610 family)
LEDSKKSMARDVKCSSCGAELPLESQRVAVVVCPHCDNTLLVSEDQVKNIGQKAVLSEPDSCLSVGWKAKCLGRELATHGRVQYKYNGGFWDEWWVHFEGDEPTSEFWISQDEGRYMLEEAIEPGFIPAFQEMRPGDKVSIAGQSYVIEEKRSAELVGYQGYLPFFVPADKKINYCDLSLGDEKATITYYPDGSIKVFKGRYLDFHELEPIYPEGQDETEPGLGNKPKRRSVQSAETVEARSVKCPNCGGDISVYDQTNTVMVMCGYCDSALDVAEGACRLLATYKKRKLKSILPLGKVGTLGNKAFRVIGRVRYKENDDGDIYTSDEYQLRADDGEYLFLCRENNSWSVSSKQKVGADFPDPRVLREGSRFRALGSSFRVTDHWRMTVTYVEGELSWIAERGNTVKYMDASSGKLGTLTAEWSGEEMEWYRGKKVSNRIIDEAFAIESGKKSSSSRSSYGASPVKSRGEPAIAQFIFVIVIIFIICLCLALGGGDGTSGFSVRSGSSGSSRYSSGGFSFGK